MRGKCSALSDGFARHFRFQGMNEKTLSIFVDESGRFQYPDMDSRFYIVALVLHDQEVDLSSALAGLDLRFRDLHLEKVCFHAGPLIRQEKAFAVMDRSFRYRIFAAMMGFARHVDFTYHCLVVDKKEVTSSEQIVRRLGDKLVEFLSQRRSELGAFDRVKIYYDCGQSPVTNLLHRTFSGIPGVRIEFAQAVTPERYRLFQIADLVCTVKFISEKISNGLLGCAQPSNPRQGNAALGVRASGLNPTSPNAVNQRMPAAPRLAIAPHVASVGGIPLKPSPPGEAVTLVRVTE